MKTKTVEKRRLGQQVFEILMGQILSGAYAPGWHLSEINICTEMGVSRTPVREALYKLEEKGLVISHPNRGFFVPPLSKVAVIENYPIIATLEALALKISSPFLEADLAKLRTINGKIKAGKPGPLDLFQLDLDFHAALLEPCKNAALLDLIQTRKQQIRRLDGGYKRGLAGRELAFAQHQEIITFLEKGENTKAAALLEKHWMDGIETVNRWIDSQEPEENRNVKKTA